MDVEHATQISPESLPLAVLVEASLGEDGIPCDECEDPEQCEAQGECELDLVEF